MINGESQNSYSHRIGQFNTSYYNRNTSMDTIQLTLGCINDDTAI